MKKISLFILLIVVVLGGCESFFYQPAITKEELIKEKIQLEKKMVMNALFDTSDDSLKVGLYWVVSPLEADYYDDNSISNAQVTLSDGSSEVELLYDETIKKFCIPQSQMPLETGKQYHLMAIADGIEVSATATVPHNNIAIAAEKLDESDWYSQRAELTIQDVAGEDNYFEIQVWGLVNNDYYIGGYIEYDEFNDFPCELRSDYRNDGELLQYNIRYDLWDVNESDTINYFIKVYHISSDYYQYQEEVCWYIGSDPFIEPAQLYSNIENGLGIFAIAASQTIQL